VTEMNPEKNESKLNMPMSPRRTHCFSELSVALIKFCIQDGDVASKEISERLSSMQSLVNETKRILKNTNSATIETAENVSDVGDKLDEIATEIMNTVITLQFFDRISQRMEHAVESVEAISDAASIKSQTLEQRFTMDDERILYDALLEGLTVDEALDKANQKLSDTIECKGTDIELF